MVRANTNNRYYIQQVSDMTGLSKQVIRKWEERYNLIRPERLPNGYRIYSEKDINLLLHVKTLSEEGMPIRQAVQLAEKMRGETVPSPKEPSLRMDSLNEFVLQLLEKGNRCDELELMITLQQANYEIGLAALLDQVITPFLQEVGDRWERGEWDEYQESVSSLAIRDYLVQLRRNNQHHPEAPVVLAACLPYERHEIPLHIVLLQFMLKGWRTFLVGASPAPGSIEAVIQKIRPDIVILSASTSIPFEEEPDLLEKLDAFAAKQPNCQFFIGGKGAVAQKAAKELYTIRLTDDFEDVWESIEIGK
ncbi:MAG TPA: MerR family transcriptional regulator [Sporosarcina sp.]|nr:MerR family transcriptional regulator [Sporosarcina sp.]